MTGKTTSADGIGRLRHPTDARHNAVVGYLWGEDWNGFTLAVVGSPRGFHAIVTSPWERIGRECKTVYATQYEARGRCWGMVRQACELKAAQAAERMANAAHQPPPKA